MTAVLHRALARLRGTGDALFALGVLAVVVLLVTPLPPVALDALLAMNLAIAAAVLVVTLLSRDALGLASFPSLLLLTTLYRLALNVASTRLVLSRGEAGRVIEAFGRVVVQGDHVVGAVVYAVITLVQLLVVARGAERVAEVAARFTLDALPGKQLSIDADLRAGAIDTAEARRRRRALEREGQLHGAMDGALKFVKGDAVAGVAIVLVNVVGGLLAGAARGLPLAEAARRYTLLAIGDGLVSQLPALLISVAAGVAVTRVAGEEEGATLGRELARQVAAAPAALGVVAALLALLGLAPGLPALPFLLPAAALGAAAHRLARRGSGGARSAEPGAPAAGPLPEALGPPAPVVIALAPDLHAHAAAGSFTTEGLAALRRELWRALGIRLPPVAVRAVPAPPGTYTVLLDEVPAGCGLAPTSEVVVLAPPDELALVAIPAAAEPDPLSGRTVSVVQADAAARAAALGPVRDPLERVLAAAAGILRRQARHLVGVQEVQALLDGLEPAAPALVREVSRQVPAPVLAEVLRRLLEEGVSIRPLAVILEAVLEAGPGRGPAALAEGCRRALRRHLAHAHAADGILPALLLDPAVEQELRDAISGELLALDPRVAVRLLEALGLELAGHGSPAALLTSPDVRRPLRGLVAPRFPELPVLAYDELPPELQIRPLGRVVLESRTLEGGPDPSRG